MADQEMEKIIMHLHSLELRLSRLESAILINSDNISDISEEQPKLNIPDYNTESLNEEETGIESQIGRFGLAWIGNIVLLFGISFLSQYLMNMGYRFMSAILGYISVIAVFALAHYLKKTNVHLSFMFKMNAQVLLYYITLKLHFFSSFPVIPDKTITLILLLLIVALQSFLSIRNKSQAFAALSVIFALTTATISDATHFMLPLIIVTVSGTIYYYYRFNWKALLFTSVFLSYTGFFLWLFGNPLAGHPMQMISEHHSGVIYLFALGTCFSILLLFRTKDSSADDFLIAVTFANGILFTLILLLVVLRFFSAGYVPLFSAITICCLVYSTILHTKSDWNFASAFFSLYGFMAMSIALYGLFGFPRAYLLLSVQSLIVVSMALWFRNRLIVVMNSLLLFLILVVYLLSSKPIDSVNFAFALTSLISARIVNWKKSRLQIETDLIRNLYLAEGFFMLLFALFHAVPKQFITLTWTLAALLYFLLSILLKNVKYRYLALGTMICAAFYLFIIDLARIELIYRVLALFFLSAISIGISMYYTNRIKKSDS